MLPAVNDYLMLSDYKKNGRCSFREHFVVNNLTKANYASTAIRFDYILDYVNFVIFSLVQY